MTSRVEQVVDEVHTSTLLTNIDYKFGRKALKENSDYPLVVWVPIGGQIAGPVGRRGNVGGKQYTADDGSTKRATQLKTQATQCEVSCWGANYEATEQLMHNVIAACHEKLTASVEFGAWRYTTEEENKADYAIRGDQIKFQCTLQIPILKLDQATTEVVTHAFEAIFQGQSGDVTVYP